jgi:aminopeptidase YwaD
MDIVRFMGPLWRLAGNPAFEQSQQLIRDRLTAAGLATHFESFPNNGRAWEMISGTVRLGGPTGEVLLSREQDRVALAINSYSTPPGGMTLRVVDLGRGTDAAGYDGRDVKGALVLADGPLGAVFQQAVKARGAAGVVSTDVAAYTRPGDTPGVLQWGSIPFDETLHAFGFKATPQAARRLRAAMAAGPVSVHVTIESVFHRTPNRTLVAEITGRQKPNERVVLVAHVQEPGANDNASGCGTLLSTAFAIQSAIRSGALPPPARTITFLWGDEIRASDEWVKNDPARAVAVVAMMSLDMTGEDTAKTGGTFLIEKSPDPSALWARPSDPHTEWGASKVDRALVRGNFLNDLHLAMTLRRARDTGWVVRTNPYEGGSDHTVFTRAGVPALLNWHFTDRYYHTNLDTVDKTSAAEMQHVGVAVAATAMFLADAQASDVAPMVKLLETARDARLETEKTNDATAEIMDAWRQWYTEAIGSVGRFK